MSTRREQRRQRHPRPEQADVERDPEGSLAIRLGDPHPDHREVGDRERDRRAEREQAAEQLHVGGRDQADRDHRGADDRHVRGLKPPVRACRASSGSDGSSPARRRGGRARASPCSRPRSAPRAPPARPRPASGPRPRRARSSRPPPAPGPRGRSCRAPSAGRRGSATHRHRHQGDHRHADVDHRDQRRPRPRPACAGRSGRCGCPARDSAAASIPAKATVAITPA